MRSTEGLAAANRGECDLAPIHLMDPATGEYNKPFLSPSMELIRGYSRLQTVDLPPFDRPAIDGFAVRAEETIGASAYSPLPFRLIDPADHLPPARAMGCMQVIDCRMAPMG